MSVKPAISDVPQHCRRLAVVAGAGLDSQGASERVGSSLMAEHSLRAACTQQSQWWEDLGCSQLLELLSTLHNK